MLYNNLVTSLVMPVGVARILSFLGDKHVQRSLTVISSNFYEINASCYILLCMPIIEKLVTLTGSGFTRCQDFSDARTRCFTKEGNAFPSFFWNAFWARSEREHSFFFPPTLTKLVTSCQQLVPDVLQQTKSKLARTQLINKW